ncbi:hypothetical protein BX667DRAFT_504175 [Coemansia mojavensis]|nr:hypothetical protein BX667DRAFT_504175 [Coemansia mojavensis]
MTVHSLCFVLACYRFLEIGRQRIAMRKKKSIAQWAGKRIMCIGDYAEDPPENVLSEEEKGMPKEGLSEHLREFNKPYMYQPEICTSYSYSYACLLGGCSHNPVKELLPIASPPALH